MACNTPGPDPNGAGPPGVLRNEPIVELDIRIPASEAAVFVTPPPTTPHRPRPVSGLGTAVVALGVAVLAELLLRLVASWLAYGVLFTGADGGIGTLAQRLDTPMLLLLVSVILLVPTLIAAVVTTLAWVHRACTNAAALSPNVRLRHTPASSVALLLLPIANLWFLRPILEDACTASSPHGRDDRGVRLVRVFWTTTVVSAALSLLGHLASTVVGDQLY